MKNKKKIIAVLVTLVLVVGIAVAGTLAFLTDTTTEIKNTFTVGKVDIDLKETKPEGQTAKMIPGSTIEKDPKVSVLAGSEDCWLFVKITAANGADDFLDYTAAEGWTALEGQTGVYYRQATAGDEFSVLAGDAVTVKGTVTSAMMESVVEGSEPTLTFKAYAVQKDNVAAAAAAWAEVAD